MIEDGVIAFPRAGALHGRIRVDSTLSRMRGLTG